MPTRSTPRHLVTLLALWGLVLSACNRDAPDAVGRAMTATTLGSVYLQEGRLPEAETEFRQVIDLLPRAASGYSNLALVFVRSGRYREAETQLHRALDRDTTEVSTYLLLAKVYELTGRPEEARQELLRLTTRDSTNPKVLFSLAELAEAEAPGSVEALDYMARVVATAPGNLAARLRLAAGLATHGLADSAVGQLEALRGQMPQPPAETMAVLDQTLRLLRSGDDEAALASLARFQRYLELTPEFQSHLRSIQGPGIGGPLEGFPILTYSPILQLPGQSNLAQPAIVFRDATTEAGLGSLSGADTGQLRVLVVGDYDGDGVDDLLVGSRLLRNEGGRYVETTVEAGLDPVSGVLAAAFADTDNDGRLDLYTSGPEGRHLFQRSAGGGLEEVRARLDDSVAPEQSAVWADLDHDGDLDLFLGTEGLDRVFRNNLDGTFTLLGPEAGLAGRAASTRGVVIGDFNDDGLIDVVTVGAAGNHAVHLNLGQSRFGEEAATGFTPPGVARAVTAADYDGDGDLDLLVVGEGVGEGWMFSNRGDGSFLRADDTWLKRALARLSPRAVSSFDYDNDGDLDLIVTGKSSTGEGPGTVLLTNDGHGNFEDRSDILPDSGGGDALIVTDFDNDGDEDLLIAGPTGVRVLRNDGGNTNFYVKVQLTALRTGSGKNNAFGIGARVEIRSGDLYQSRLVTGRVTHFGLAAHRTADVIRVTWPNGVPQVLSPGSSGEIIEQDVLKGSCAFAYAWNGERYEFVTDVMWRSAIGMPLGIMGGNTTYAPAQASTEYLRISGDLLRPQDGRYSLQLTEELWETAYIDEVKLLVVDHPDSVDVFVNERFVPPGPTDLRLYQVPGAKPPVSAIDGEGMDVLSALTDRDHQYASYLTPTRYQGITTPHELILDLGDFPATDSLFLFLNGWIFPSDASINVAVAQSSAVRVQWPSLDVIDRSGRWQTAIPDLGFPSGKAKTVIADLTGKFPTKDHRVRIRSNMQIYWDQAFISGTASTSPVTVTVLTPVSANLHYRGFSRTYRQGGRYGPHWFDYGTVSTEPRWRPITGSFTRYGDVVPLLGAADDRYIVMAPGDETTIAFDAADAPALPAGWRRDFVLYTDGWIKDSDLNTALGTAVEPLPFHAMTEYPYGSGERFPAGALHQEYLRSYQTRTIAPQGR
jgi:hypothetical protein